MPSLDTIRTVTVRGQTDGVNEATAALNQLTTSIKTANDNLRQTSQVANDNASGWQLTGEGALTAANHLRQAAEAAYAFSPAFRGVVNEMATPALGAASTALTAVAAGIVTATNYVGTGLIALAGTAEKVSPAFLTASSGLRSIGITLEAFSPTVATVGTSILGLAGTLLTRFLPVVGQIILLYDGIKALGDAWTYGKDKLAEYVQISQSAVQSNVSTDFFQRIGKAATDTKQPVDALLVSIKQLNTATADQLGGSTGQKRLDELTEAGNFKGNSGVGQLGQANTTEQKYRAVASLIDQALDKGQRLAALDIAKTFLGDAAAANLAKDSDYLDKMLAAIDGVSSADLVPQDQVDRAVQLQNRLDAAEQILSQRWHPIQDLLTQLGIKMQEVWVSIVEAIAAAVDKVFQFVTAIGNALDKMAQLLGGWSSIASVIGKAATYLVPGLPLVSSAASALFGGQDAPQDAAMTAARGALASRMGNPANINAAREQTIQIQSKVRGDTSKDPNADKPDTGSWDRTVGSIQKYIEVTNAAAQSVDAGVAEQERLKAIAELTAAGIKDGLTPETAKLNAEMSKLPGIAGAAAEALAKAKVQSQIRFGANTGLLSSEDVQIATQLKGLYPDVATALNSVEASGLRANDAAKQLSSAIETNLTSGLTDIFDGTKSVGQGASDMAVAFAKSIDQMVIKILVVEPLLRQLQALVSASGILSFGAPGVNASGAINGAIGPTSVNGAPLVALHGGGIVGSEATFSRYVHPAYFDDAPRFHSGGIAGDEVPIIARKGEGVFTAGQMAALGAMASPQVNVTLVESPGGGGGVTQKKNSNGGLDIQVEVAQIAAKSAATPGGAVNRVLTDQYRGSLRLTGR